MYMVAFHNERDENKILKQEIIKLNDTINVYR